MRLVVEARHLVVGLRLEPRFGEPALAVGVEERQPAAMHEIVDERGDEDGLSRARQPGDAEPDGRRAAAGDHPVEIGGGDPRLVGEWL